MIYNWAVSRHLIQTYTSLCKDNGQGMGPASIHLGGLHNGLGMGSATGGIHPSNEECGIREVWAHNMEEEFKTICQVSKAFSPGGR